MLQYRRCPEIIKILAQITYTFNSSYLEQSHAGSCACIDKAFKFNDRVQKIPCAYGACMFTLFSEALKWI